MANDTQRALCVCKDLIKSHEASHPTLQFPQVTTDWLGAIPSPVLIEEHEEDVLDHGIQDDEIRGGASVPMTLKSMSEDPIDDLAGVSSTKTSCDISYQWIWRIIFHLWNRPQILRARLLLSCTVRSVNHSSHLRHALKNAAGVALLSIPAFYPPDSSGRYVP